MSEHGDDLFIDDNIPSNMPQLFNKSHMQQRTLLATPSPLAAAGGQWIQSLCFLFYLEMSLTLSGHRQPPPKFVL